MRGMRRTAAASGWGVTMALPLLASAQGADGGGGVPVGLVAGGAVALLIIAGLLFMPRLRALPGRLVVRDAFGPSEFGSTSLSVARGWSAVVPVDAIPARDGLLVALGIKRGFGRDVEVTLRFDKDGKSREVVAGRLAPGQKERVGDLIIDYDDGRSSDSAV